MGSSSEEEDNMQKTSSDEHSNADGIEIDESYPLQVGSSSATPKRQKTGVAGSITLRVEGHTLIFGSRDRRTNVGGRLFEKKVEMEGEMGANHEPKGEIRTLNGKLYFRDKRCRQWSELFQIDQQNPTDPCLARGEYHEKFRKQFLEEDARKGDFGKCLHVRVMLAHTDLLANPPDRGDADGDETSYIDYQKEWGEDESTWNHVTDDRGRQLFSGGNRPNDLDCRQPTDLWKHKGVLLIDQDNHPLRHLPSINRTFSTALEGWRLDALRKRFPYLLVQEYVVSTL